MAAPDPPSPALNLRRAIYATAASAAISKAQITPPRPDPAPACSAGVSRGAVDEVALARGRFASSALSAAIS